MSPGGTEDRTSTPPSRRHDLPVETVGGRRVPGPRPPSLVKPLIIGLVPFNVEGLDPYSLHRCFEKYYTGF